MQKDNSAGTPSTPAARVRHRRRSHEVVYVVNIHLVKIGS